MTFEQQGRVRRFTREDTAAVYDVFAAYIKDSNLSDYSFPVDQFLATDTPHAAFVAEDESGRIVGVTAAYIEETVDDVRERLTGTTLPTTDELASGRAAGPIGYLASGYVLPDRTREGVGSALYERGESYCADVGCDAVVAEAWAYDRDRDARAFLERKGHEAVFEADVYWGPEYDCSICGDTCSCGVVIYRKWL